MREGAALAVLAGQAHRKTLIEQRREGKMLAHRPIDAGACIDHLAATLQQALDRLVGVEILRDCRDAPANLLQRVDSNARITAPRLVFGKADVGPAAIEPVGLVRPITVGGCQLLVEMGAEASLHSLDIIRADHAFLDQPLRIELDGCRV